ncbi:MAG: AAA family ATPase [Marinovum sp.]|nr:AAA family ATPase [Marinovum sp.]MBT7908265.1 AAA family ATPase [Marinovum sp.]
MKRIMVVGCPGSGKSTVAVTIAQKLDLPVVHLDQIHYAPGWQERTKAEKTRLATRAEQADKWVIDGNLSATYPHRLSRADCCVWLDIPLQIRLWRVLKRRLYGARVGLPRGSPDQLTWEFIKYVLRSDRLTRPKYQKLHLEAGST